LGGAAVDIPLQDRFGGIAMPMVIAVGARGCRTLEPEPAMLIGRRTSRGGGGLPKLRANRP
jgi:hypothetical protein